MRGWAPSVQLGEMHRAWPEALSALSGPPLSKPSPTVTPVTMVMEDPATAPRPSEIPPLPTELRLVPLSVRKQTGVGFFLASFIHLIIFAYFTVFSGTVGSFRPTSIEAIEIELVSEPPGEAAVEETAQQPITPSTEEETAPSLPEATVAQNETLREALPPRSAEFPPEERAPEPEPTPTPFERVEQTPLPPGVKPVASSKPEPVRTPAAKASRQARDAVAGDNSALIDAYKIAVASKIARNKPAANTAASAQGVVLISFTIASDGNVGGLKLTQSSGHEGLDQAALTTISKSSPFPPPPFGAPRMFTVPIRFNIR